MIGDDKLYRAVRDPSGHLAEAGDGGLLGAVLNNLDNTLMGRAPFFEAQPEDLADGSTSNGGSGGGLFPVLLSAAGVAVGILGTVKKGSGDRIVVPVDGPPGDPGPVGVADKAP